MSRRPVKAQARFGRAWWDRNGHIGFRDGDAPVYVVGFHDDGSDYIWPKPCPTCVQLLEEDHA